MFCCVPRCRILLENGKKARLFNVPKDSKRLKEWEESLGVELKESWFVCEKHFAPEDIKDYSTHYDTQGNLIAKVKVNFLNFHVLAYIIV